MTQSQHASPASQAQVLPTYHLRPAYGWLNDPNGMVEVDGRWHVFYQHNDAGPFHDAIAWGHASTSDLVHWRSHPVAFRPEPGAPDSFGCWSGVAVTGLDRPAVVYSGVIDESQASTIVLRWGSTDLDTWGEPIVVGHTPAEVRVMRDPFLFAWHGRRWALLGAGMPDGSGAVLLYSCEDILTWHYEGVFLDQADPGIREQTRADIWECPQLICRTPEQDGAPAAIILSLQENGQLNEVVGVHGRLVDHGGRPGFEPLSVTAMDTGTRFYAPQLAPDPEQAGDLLIGWIREDNLSPQTHAVSGCMTLPRSVRVDADGLSQSVHPAVNALALGPATRLGAGTHDLPLQARLVQPPTGSPEGGIRLAGLVDGQRVEYPVPPGTAWVDAGVVEAFPAAAGIPKTLRAEPGSWQVIVAPDVAVEVRTVLTDAFG